MKRRAAIDIGTNTALLLVAEVSEGNVIQPLYQQEKIVRLGQGVDRKKNLNDAAIERTLNAIQEYFSIVDDFNAELVVISGTSAVRDAGNRDFLVERIRQRFGVELRILSGQEEAILTYQGALSNKGSLDGEILLVDIGGGSTECIVGTQSSIEDSVSMDIGSVRLTERCLHSDPVSDSEFAQMQDLINTHLRSAFADWRKSPRHFVGVAGTVTTVAAMSLGLEIYDGAKVDSCVLAQNLVNEILSDLKSKTIEERKRIAGLKPERADVILAGVAILAELMQFFDFDQVLVSDRGLRFGLLLEP